MERMDWNRIESALDAEGAAVLPGLLTPEQTKALSATGSTRPESVVGGSRCFFADELPAFLAEWRSIFYRRLAPLANRWNEKLGVAYRYPGTLDEFMRRNHEAGQSQPLSHVVRLSEGEDLPLRQWRGGEHVFPLQVVALLSEPGKDFHGGEFVMTERRPRMQSRPMVLPLRAGDAAVICATSRPLHGSRGYYRADLKHAISSVRDGERIGLELLLHDGC